WECGPSVRSWFDADHADFAGQRRNRGMLRPLESGTTWTVTSLVEHSLLAFASSEHYRPAEQYRVESVEHDRRRDQKFLDVQGEGEIRPHRGLEDEAQAPHDVADADGVPETGRTLPAVVHPG